MKKQIIQWIIILWLLPAVILAAKPKNIILIIGDGMGPEEIKAAAMYESGADGWLSFAKLSYRGEMTTHAADNPVTDSAASATAMATGKKVNNGVISMAIPGDKSELKTILEIAKSQGKATGLVTTTHLTHATPACFAAHEPSRNHYDEIAQDFMLQTRPDCLLGGGGKGLSVSMAEMAGYTVLTDTNQLQQLDTENTGRLAFLYDDGHLPYIADEKEGRPSLMLMTKKALNMLDNDPEGFFLMVEAGRIDHAGHANNIEKNILETLELSDTVDVALKWANGRDDTLIIVTADHETGGLKIKENKGAGNIPKVAWSSGGHTATPVPVFATGPNASMIPRINDNTDIFLVMTTDAEALGTAAATGSLWISIGIIFMVGLMIIILRQKANRMSLAFA